MNPEKKILLLTDWFLPGYKAGGPIRSCANLVARLSKRFQFRVVTGDTDLDEVKPYANVKSNQWNEREDGTPVYYFSKDARSYRSIRKLLLQESYDVLYLNSFFSIPFTLLPLLAVRLNRIKCRIIIAPRGMMGKGSLSIKSGKKKLFIRMAKLTGLFNGVTWHASTPGEMEEIKAVFGENVRVKKAMNLTAPRRIEKIVRIKETGKVRFFCLARISPVKNILAVFRYLRQVNPAMTFTIHFYGTLEDETYVNKCKSLAAGFGPNVSFEFKGPIENSRIQEMIKEYHFMILPTLNENFGHAIVESFAAGCPVVISNCTPWKNLEQQKAGWDLPLERDDLFVEKINDCAAMDQDTYMQWSEGAYRLGEKIVEDEDGLKENIVLFLS